VAESVAREKSIAVLPFVNMSSDPEQEYFSDGLSEEILNLLAKIPDLKVIGRTSSFAFKGKNEDLRLIGKALDVNTVLEGSVRKSGVRVRITAQLIDAASGAHLWSETYDRTLEDIFEVQDDVASAIFDALQVHVGTAPKRGRPTENAEAYALFLKARAAMNLPDAESAVELSLRAIELDPRFAEAHELLAYGYWWAAGYTMTPREAQLAVRRAATRAIELDPSLRFAQALAVGSSDENYYVEEIEALSRVILNKPNHAAAAETLLWDLTSTGYFEEATLLAKQLVDVDPLSAIAHYRLAQAHLAAGRTSDGLEALGFSAELGSESAKRELAWINLFDKRDKRAIERYQALLQQNDLPTAWVAELLEEASKPTTGEAYLDQHLPQIASSVSGGYYDGNLSSNLLGMYLKFGFLDRFYELIFEAGISASEWSPTEDYINLGITDRRSGFTAHPRFLELAEAQGLIELWDKRGPPDFCEKLSGQWVCE
jgi:TolB-like protein